MSMNTQLENIITEGLADIWNTDHPLDFTCVEKNL